jgi:hypothetical protein
MGIAWESMMALPQLWCGGHSQDQLVESCHTEATCDVLLLLFCDAAGAAYIQHVLPLVTHRIGCAAVGLLLLFCAAAGAAQVQHAARCGGHPKGKQLGAFGSKPAAHV